MIIDLNKISPKVSIRLKKEEAEHFVIIVIIPGNKYYRFIRNSNLNVTTAINIATRFDSEKSAKKYMLKYGGSAKWHVEKLKSFLKKVYTVNFKYYPDDPYNYVIEKYISRNLNPEDNETEDIKSVKNIAMKIIDQYLSYCQEQIRQVKEELNEQIKDYNGSMKRASDTLNILDPNSLKFIKSLSDEEQQKS